MAVSLGIAAVIVAISSVLTYFVAKQLRIIYLINKFEGPPALPIIGNVHQILGDTHEIFMRFNKLIEEYRQKSNGIMRLWFGSTPNLSILSAKHMEVILSSTKHITKSFTYEFIEPWLNKGLLTSTGKKWFERRKLLTPTFHFSILKSFLDVFNEQSFIFAKKMEKYADQPEPVNIFPHITYCVLDVICATAMGKYINAQGSAGNDYVKAVLSMGEIITQRSLRPWLWPNFIFDRTASGKEQKRLLKLLHGVTDTMIDERMKDPPRSTSGTKDKEEDDDIDSHAWRRKNRIAFLDLLLQMHRDNPSFSLKDIREEVDTFMFEGHDTTAAAAGWAVLMVGLHPGIQARLHDELDEVFRGSDRPVTPDDLGKMSYLNCVMKETLRISPSVPVVVRALDEDIVLDGKTVPKETSIALDFYALHHDPEQFPDPDKFDPDRFLPENVAKRHAFAYTPFSAGPRNCIGQRFAMMEIKLILANLLRKFTIESVEDYMATKPAGQLILKPLTASIHVKLHTRK